MYVCMYVCKYECMYVYVGRDSWTRLQSVGHRIEATRRSCSQPGWPFHVRATTVRDATGSPRAVLLKRTRGRGEAAG